MRPVPLPSVWARYADRWRAIEAADTDRFGPGPWSVEYRPRGDGFDWALVALDPYEEEDEDAC